MKECLSNSSSSKQVDFSLIDLLLRLYHQITGKVRMKLQEIYPKKNFNQVEVAIKASIQILNHQTDRLVNILYQLNLF
jgi:hypothetical protein